MELKKNERVYFEDGHSEGYLEARWSEKKQAFYADIIVDDEKIRIFSTDVRMVEKKSSSRRSSKMVEINPDHETEKAYAIYAGENGMVSRGNSHIYYTYVAKSICEKRNGKIFAPIWAVK